MVTRDEYLAKTKGYKRPAINFNKRDDIREFAGSGMGQNYHKMMDLQRQAPTFQKNDPRIDDLKQRRRQFNRYDKYNSGSIFGETPQHMQEDYRFESNELRNRAKPVYNQMYPLTGGFMDYTEGGGMFGLAARAFKNLLGDSNKMGSDIMKGVGIGGAVPTEEATEEVLNNYAQKTFGAYPSDVHPELPRQNDMPDFKGQAPMEPQDNIAGFFNAPTLSDQELFGEEQQQSALEDFEEMKQSELLLNTPDGPAVIDERETAIMGNNVPQPLAALGTPNPQGDFPIRYPQDKPIENIDLTNNKYYNDLNQAEIDYLMGRTDSIADEELSGYTPNYNESFNDDLRESGIASMMKSGLNLAGRRPYEEDYRAFVESSGPSKVQVTYEDFIEYYLPRIQESRGVLRAGLNSQGRR